MLRRILIVLLTTLTLVATTLVVLAWRGDEVLRWALERQLQARLVPIVTIDGPLEWRLTGQPRLVVRNLRLRDAAGETLVTVREIDVVVERDSGSPRQWGLASVDIDGVDVRLGYRDGVWDALGWLVPTTEDAAAQPALALAVPIRRVRVTEARLRVGGDLEAGLEHVDIEAGPFLPGSKGRIALRTEMRASAPLALQLQLGVAADMAFETGLLAFEGVEVNLRGAVAGWELANGTGRAGLLRIDADGAVWATNVGVNFALNSPDFGLQHPASASQTEALALCLEGQMSLATLSGRGARWHGTALRADVQARHDDRVVGAQLGSEDATLDAEGWRLAALTLDLSAAGAAPPARVRLAGQLAGSIAGAAPALVLQVAQADAELPHPADVTMPLLLSFNAQAHVNPRVPSAHGEIAGSFDDSRFDGHWRFDAAAVPPLEVGLTLDRLDLDRYLPPAKGGRDEAGQDEADLAVWRNWPLRAELQVGELRVQGFVTTDARLQLLGGGAAGPATSVR